MTLDGHGVTISAGYSPACLKEETMKFTIYISIQAYREYPSSKDVLLHKVVNSEVSPFVGMSVQIGHKVFPVIEVIYSVDTEETSVFLKPVPGEMSYHDDGRGGGCTARELVQHKAEEFTSHGFKVKE